MCSVVSWLISVDILLCTMQIIHIMENWTGCPSTGSHPKQIQMKLEKNNKVLT